MGDYPNFNSGPTSNFYDVKDNIRSLSLNVRYREQPGQHMLVLSITGFDPAKELFVCAKHAAKKHFSRRAISLPISNQAHVRQSSSAATEGLSL
jgi:hypothetical protein